jgi:hypothetical protein
VPNLPPLTPPRGPPGAGIVNPVIPNLPPLTPPGGGPPTGPINPIVPNLPPLTPPGGGPSGSGIINPLVPNLPLLTPPGGGLPGGGPPGGGIDPIVPSLPLPPSIPPTASIDPIAQIVAGADQLLPPIDSSGGPGGRVHEWIQAILGLAATLDLATLPADAQSGVAPASPAPPAPGSPDAPVGVSGSSSSLLFAGFAALFLLLGWTIPRLVRRLDLPSALQQPTPFLPLFERPG